MKGDIEFPKDLTWDELHEWEIMVYGMEHINQVEALKIVLDKRIKNET